MLLLLPEVCVCVFSESMCVCVWSVTFSYLLLFFFQSQDIQFLKLPSLETLQQLHTTRQRCRPLEQICLRIFTEHSNFLFINLSFSEDR